MMQPLSLDDAKELRSDYKHLIGTLFQSKEVTDVIVGPVSQRSLVELINHRHNTKVVDQILNDADGFDVYLLLDYNGHSGHNKAVIMLRSVLHYINGDI